MWNDCIDVSIYLYYAYIFFTDKRTSIHFDKFLITELTISANRLETSKWIIYLFSIYGNARKQHSFFKHATNSIY